MARDLLIEKVADYSGDSLAVKYESGASRCWRGCSSSSTMSQRQYLAVDVVTSDDEFKRYRKFSQDAGRSRQRADDGIVMSLLRRCRSQSSSRSRRRRPTVDMSDDDNIDNEVSEEIELRQLSGVAVTRLSELVDAGHKFVTVYVDVPVWCDHCGQLIILVYGHYVLCQCEYLVNFMSVNVIFIVATMVCTCIQIVATNSVALLQ